MKASDPLLCVQIHLNALKAGMQHLSTWELCLSRGLTNLTRTKLRQQDVAVRRPWSKFLKALYLLPLRFPNQIS